MKLSDYKEWYQTTFLTAPYLSDAELKQFPYFLTDDEELAINQDSSYPQQETNTIDSGNDLHAIERARCAGENGEKESPLSITSGLLYRGGTNHD